jgi:hypothetical protein
MITTWLYGILDDDKELLTMTKQKQEKEEQRGRRQRRIR